MASSFLLFLLAPQPSPYSSAPGLLQLMAWLQRLLWNSNVGPISFSESWGVMRQWSWGVRWWGRRERITADRGEMLQAFEWGQLHSLWCKIVCVCVSCRCAFMHAPLLFTVFLCIYGYVGSLLHTAFYCILLVHKYKTYKAEHNKQANKVDKKREKNSRKFLICNKGGFAA